MIAKVAPLLELRKLGRVRLERRQQILAGGDFYRRIFLGILRPGLLCARGNGVGPKRLDLILFSVSDVNALAIHPAVRLSRTIGDKFDCARRLRLHRFNVLTARPHFGLDRLALQNTRVRHLHAGLGNRLRFHHAVALRKGGLKNAIFSGRVEIHYHPIGGHGGDRRIGR